MSDDNGFSVYKSCNRSVQAQSCLYREQRPVAYNNTSYTLDCMQKRGGFPNLCEILGWRRKGRRRHRQLSADTHKFELEKSVIGRYECIMPVNITLSDTKQSNYTINYYLVTFYIQKCILLRYVIKVCKV